MNSKISTAEVGMVTYFHCTVKNAVFSDVMLCGL